MILESINDVSANVEVAANPAEGEPHFVFTTKRTESVTVPNEGGKSAQVETGQEGAPEDPYGTLAFVKDVLKIEDPAKQEEMRDFLINTINDPEFRDRGAKDKPFNISSGILEFDQFGTVWDKMLYEPQWGSQFLNQIRDYLNSLNIWEDKEGKAKRTKEQSERNAEQIAQNMSRR